MRFMCDVEIFNRCLPSYNLKSSSRSNRGFLSIGQKPNSTNKNRTVYILFSSSKDKFGTQYLVKENIERVFCQYIKEGKATIRLKSPEIDLLISKADAIQLKSFLNVLKGCIHQNSLPPNKSLTVLAPIAAKQMESCKKKLSISRKEDYPLLKGFPKSLDRLTISSCSLKKLDPRILKLDFLQFLDLSENLLENLPDSFCNLRLSVLILKRNQLTSLPLSLLEPPLVDCLTNLDVSENKIERLPENLDKLQRLSTLQASHNQLSRLPVKIGHLRCLKYLRLSKNEIPHLPASFIKLSLVELDISQNKFIYTRPRVVQIKKQFPSLQTICAKLIVQQGIPYNDWTLFRHLQIFVENYHSCWCGEKVYQRFIQCIFKFNLTLNAVSLCTDNNMRAVPLEGYFCCKKCCNTYTILRFRNEI